ncbi:MAG: hypothetical protein ACRDYA_21665 [Egibacteraceae bacterium]
MTFTTTLQASAGRFGSVADTWEWHALRRYYASVLLDAAKDIKAPLTTSVTRFYFVLRVGPH